MRERAKIVEMLFLPSMDVISVVIVGQHEDTDVCYGAKINKLLQLIFHVSLINNHREPPLRSINNKVDEDSNSIPQSKAFSYEECLDRLKNKIWNCLGQIFTT